MPLIIIWFRKDFRLNDNLCFENLTPDQHILPIYIHDQNAYQDHCPGAASLIWLDKALHSLNQTLNGSLNVYKGDTVDILQDLCQRYTVSEIRWNTDFEPWSKILETNVKTFCQETHIKSQSFNSNYLFAPHDVLKDDGSYYKVFTAFKRKALKRSIRPCSKPNHPPHFVRDNQRKTNLSNLDIFPTHPYAEDLISKWQVGERAAKEKLIKFIEAKIHHYKIGRDIPSLSSTSMLSPHLHFGEISPVEIYHLIHEHAPSYADEENWHHFISELLWREFSVYLLSHFNDLPSKNFNPKFDHFPWLKNDKFLSAWQKGQTGYPIVDAGMRELWQTGYMHNRVRMICASFLIKNLNIHWHHGQSWFWNCLFDADLANNSASWQWVAGSGADAAPYFRIFNPITQGEKFDKDGRYTRRYLPELAKIPQKFLFKPWEAPSHILAASQIQLGKTYPMPIVDLASSRQNALAAYKNLS